MGNYILNYVSYAFILKEYIATEGNVSKYNEMSVRAEYLSCLKTKTNLYWKQTKINKI